MKRAFGVIAALVLLGGVAFALLKPTGQDDPGSKVVTVTGVIGSEKRDFFKDPDVVAALAEQGLKVDVQTTGSWLMSESDLGRLDFAFPASLSPAEAIRRQLQLKDGPVRPFYSPLVVLAHRSTAKVLAQNGLASQDQNSRVWTFRMDEYVNVVRAGRRWEELTGAKDQADLSGAVFMTTTDPAESSSGALYLALVSYLLNNHQVVSSDAEVQQVKAVLSSLTSKQGIQKSSSDEPFRDFLSNVGNPLVLAYESQAAQLAVEGKGTGDMVVLYPDTTISSDHTIVGRTAAGQKLAALLNDDQKLRKLEARYGFRPQSDPAAFGLQTAGRENPAFAADLTAARVKQAPVPSSEALAKLVDAAKGK
ncbi:hypothetical protein OG618_11170 [Kitasatospora sp. NBC_01246]|uniref:hypothetical protein n=1 Tax=Kitasatospora sp. NBC_01246 TaxID=2903570 RepID=UPI002E331AA2|nr:hypothetical protein [Kitasatospora sp. NBC_01246]